MKNRLPIHLLPLLVAAVLLRFWNLYRLGLTHFDEGSYAMAGQWIASLGQEDTPPQAGQAPALFPILVGLVFFLLGSHDFVAVGVSATTGSLTVLLIWWIGKSWFDDNVARGAALILATCEYHLIYSRMALTDTTFVLLFWAALALLFRGLERQDKRLLLGGAVLTGLAWNTKYHGFFPVLIILVFCFARWLLRRSGTAEFHRSARRLGWAFGVALGTMLPWIALVAWTTGWTEILTGMWNHSIGSGPFPATLPSTLYFYLTNWVAAPILLLSLVGVAAVLKRGHDKGIFLITTVLFLAVAALFYTSFPRLLLPLIPGLCLLASVGAVSLLELLKPLPLPVSASLLFLVLSLWNGYEALPVIRIRTDSYRETAEFLESQQEPVLSQLSKNYYFYDRGHSVEMRWHAPADLETLVSSKPDWIVAIDPVFEKLPLHRDWFEQHKSSLTLLREIPVHAYDVIHYQGIRRPWNLSSLPGEEAPALPGQAGIRIYRLSVPRGPLR